MKVIAIMPKLHDYLASTIIEGLYKNNVEISYFAHYLYCC